MDDGTVCNVCGGTDFYTEVGTFFCSGCDTQTQIIEHEINVVVASERATVSKKKTGNNRKVTSWEYYNYIILGLTEELIGLGAEETIKPIVMYLWMHYLKQLQVISQEKNALPKIQLLNSAEDAEIIYGKPARKKRKWRRGSTSSDSTVGTSVGARSKLSAKIRVLDQSQAEVKSESHQDEEDGVSYSGRTLDLSSVKSAVIEASKKSNKRIAYNTSSTKELLKHQSRPHMRKHQHDLDSSLKCHKMTYLTTSNAYRMGAQNLSLNKLYSLLYLALLINGDNIGLAEMLRYIKEGRLSFNRYDHFFPENYLGSKVLFGKSQRNVELMNEQFRVAVAKVAKLLHVSKYVSPPNFLQLCEKYCKELNLPDEIHRYAANILITLEPKMQLKAKSLTIPNYEARVLSIILVVLKLIFCFDGKTEYEFSNFANIVNELPTMHLKMFDIIAWLKHIEYRKLVLSEHNFTAKFDHNKDYSEGDLFVQFMQDEKSGDHVPKNLDKIHQMLTLLKNNSRKKDSNIIFLNTLTPFYDYTKKLVDECIAEDNDYFENILSQEFASNSLEFLMNPMKYLQLIDGNAKIEILSGGANENFVFESLLNFRHFRDLQTRLYNQKMLVHLKTELMEDENMSSIKMPNYNKTVRDTDSILRMHNQMHARKFEKNKMKYTDIGNCDMKADSEPKDVRNDRSSIFKHYIPWERYWVKYRANCKKEEEFEEFLNTLPTTFLILLKDCARICEQSVKQFYEEFQMTEIYIIYCSGLRQKEKVLDTVLLNLISRAKANW